MTEAADQTLFSAHIRPHRSLGADARRLVITLVAVAGIISSIPFMIVGAWPVAGYFGLDVLLLWIAFRVNQNRAAELEEVLVTPVQLYMRRIGHRGDTAEWRFNPAWVRIERGREDEEFGLHDLSIVSGPTRVAVARHLSPLERADFARAFEAGLAQARRGPRFT
ncbi:MAG: DUF2244 domain-containing protein [Beijerinckiaceae bacterium]